MTPTYIKPVFVISVHKESKPPNVALGWLGFVNGELKQVKDEARVAIFLSETAACEAAFAFENKNTDAYTDITRRNIDVFNENWL